MFGGYLWISKEKITNGGIKLQGPGPSARRAVLRAFVPGVERSVKCLKPTEKNGFDLPNQRFNDISFQFYGFE